MMKLYPYLLLGFLCVYPCKGVDCNACDDSCEWYEVDCQGKKAACKASAATIEALTSPVEATCANDPNSMDGRDILEEAKDLLIDLGFFQPEEFNGVQIRFCSVAMNSGAGMAPSPIKILMHTDYIHYSKEIVALTLAHEMTHIRQYRTWGTEGFQCRYAEELASGNGYGRSNRVESEAYDFQDLVEESLYPDNNSCNNPTTLWMGSRVSGTTEGATSDPLNSCFSATAVNAPGVWYSVEGNGRKITVTTCTSVDDGDYNSQIAVYMSECNSLACIAGNNDDSYDDCGSESRVTWQSVDGVLYRIHVYGYNTGETGSFGLVARPGNERCWDAEHIYLSTLVEGSTYGASDRIVPACDGDPASWSPGVWYRTTGTGSLMQATTCTGNGALDGDFDSIISIWEGSCSSLNCVARNDDSDMDNCGEESTVTWESNAGQNYYIHVHGYGGQTGSFGLVVTQLGLGCPEAEGPLRLGRIESISTATFSATSSDVPTCGEAPFSTSPGLWYRVTGTGNEMTATTCTGNGNYDGDFDSIISIWEGSCTTLRCVAGNDENDEDDCGTESTVTWDSEDGHTYFIHVYGFQDDLTGSFGLVVDEDD